MGIEEVIRCRDRGLSNHTIDLALELIESGEHEREVSRLLSIISEVMFRKAQYTDAVRYGEKSVEADPENPDGYSGLGWAEYWLGRNQDGAEHLKKAVELDPENGEYHYRLGSIYNNAFGRFAEAEAEFTSAVALDPEHTLAFQQRGICRYNQGRHGEAEADYRMAAELGDAYSAYCLKNNGSGVETPGEKFSLSRDFWGQNDSRTAVDYMKQALEQGFDSREKTLAATLELADKLSVMKLSEDAEHYYGKALELEPDSADAFGRRGWHYYITSRDEKAEADLENAMSLEPANPVHPARLGNFYAASGRPDRGLEILDPAIERESLSPDLFYSRALCHKALGNDDMSKKDFRKAEYLGHRSALNDRRTAYGDEYPMDFFSAGIEMGDRNNAAGAVEQFRKAADMFREQSRLRGDLAWRYAAKSLHNLGYYINLSGGDGREARSTIREALEMDPGYVDAWVTLGNVHNSSSENDEALECYTRAIQLQPNEGRGYYSRGRIFMDRKEWDRAVSDFSSAVNLYRRRDWKGDAYFNRARCHEGAGRMEEAAADYLEAFNHGIQGAMEESLRLKGAFGTD